MRNRIVLILTVLLCLLTGCSSKAVWQCDVFYPKENQGNVWKSRAEFHRSSSVTRANSGAFYNGGR